MKCKVCGKEIKKVDVILARYSHQVVREEDGGLIWDLIEVSHEEVADKSCHECGAILHGTLKELLGVE